MKATGIVRRVDDLGRIIIPNEIRRNMKIREGDPLELFVEDDGIVFKKYSPIEKIGEIAQSYADILYKTIGQPIAIMDEDGVIACSGISKQLVINSLFSDSLEAIVKKCTDYYINSNDNSKIYTLDGVSDRTGIVNLIINEKKVIGSIMVFSDLIISKEDKRLIKTASSFLSKQVNIV